MLSKVADKPKGQSISIRSIKPKFQNLSSRHWFDGNPFISHMIHALSFLFPPGEEMFVKSVNFYKDQITDPQLRKAIKAFAGQEFLHSKSHQDFNDWIIAQVPEAEAYCQSIAQAIDSNYNKLAATKPIVNLAITVALEHITAIMAASFLRKSEFLDKIHPEVRSLLIWHAIEEIEHKSVAFDVYQAVGGGYWQRVSTLLIATCMLFLKTFYYQTLLLLQDGGWRQGRAAWAAVKMLFGSNGFFTDVAKSYFHYFKPSFHPSQHNDQALIDQWHEELAKLTPIRIAGKVELDPVG